MTKQRTRHPNEPRQRVHPPLGPNGIWPAHVTPDGRVYSGKGNRPLVVDPAPGIEKREENLHVPSDRMLAVVQSGAILRPKQIAWVRQGIVNIVEKNLQKASDVLEGTQKWDSNQTRLFLGFLDKVAPRMSDNIHRHTMQPQGRDYANLTMAELEAALHDVLDDAKVIEAEPAPEKPKRKRGENPELRKRAVKKRRLSLKEVRARYLEKEPTILPPLTREQDEENRRQARVSARGLRKRASKSATLRDLELMAQMDPLVVGMAADPSQADKLDPRRAAEKFLKTPDPEAE